MSEEIHMNDDRSIQNAIYRVALSADGLLVNGVTACLAQMHSTGFIDELFDAANGNLEQLPELSEDTKSDTDKLIQVIGRNFDVMKGSLRELAGFKRLPDSRVSELISGLVGAYDQVKRAVRSLESAFGVGRPFYENRSSDSAKRIDDLIQNLPRIFLMERSKSGDQRHDLPAVSA